VVDLVDYLRNKLAHADDVVCTCPDIDVSTAQDRERVTVKGWSRDCAVHGQTAPGWDVYAVHSNVVDEPEPLEHRRWPAPIAWILAWFWWWPR
jgi:hypothetical protein